MRNMPIRLVDFVVTSTAFPSTMSLFQTVSVLSKKIGLLGLQQALTPPAFLFPILLNGLPIRYDSISF